MPFAGVEDLSHDVLRMLQIVQAENVAELVHQHRRQVHAALLALVAGRAELAVVGRRWIDKPAPAGRVIVQQDGVA